MAGKKRKRSGAARRGWETSKSPPSNRPKKLKQWSDESMQLAMAAVRSGELKMNRAADVFEVPRTTRVG